MMREEDGECSTPSSQLLPLAFPPTCLLLRGCGPRWGP